MDGVTTQPMDAIVRDLASRITADRHGRVASALLAAVGHIHDLIMDLKPTADEWRSVIGLLTDIGHSSDARRQEWVLLSDVVGASALVEDINSLRPDAATPNTLAGPFYRADAPELENGADISHDGLGGRLDVSGTVKDLEGQSVSKALVEVWQANSVGFYENQQPDLQPELNLRGRFLTDQTGQFHFSTICPRGYSLPEDGPVGRLLNGLGIKLERPAHVHFRVTAPEFQMLTTHIYDRADPAISRDALFCVKPALLGDFRPTKTANGTSYALEVNFILARLSETGQPTSNNPI